MRTAVCPHWGEIGIDDIFTRRGQGGTRSYFSLHVLLGDVILVQPDAYAQVAFKVGLDPMADSLEFDATAAPTDVASALSLDTGTRYAGQNLSTVATLFLREKSTAPAAGERAFRIESGGPFSVRPTGTPIWLWTDDAGGCPLILGEAP